MDDTIENLGIAWVEYLNEQYGLNADFQNSKEFDMQKLFPSLKPDEVYAPLWERELWKKVTPKPDAVEYLERLMNEGHEVYIVTASALGTIAMKTEEVLYKYFPYIKEQQVITTWNKQLIQGDVLVDDGVHNLEGGDFEKILFDAPYNREYHEGAHGMFRAHNWEEVYRLIQELDYHPGDIGVRI